MNDNNENLSWQAIGYAGPDPDHSSTQNDDTDKAFGPLYEGIIDLARPPDIVADDLRRFGFTVRVHGQKFKLPELAVDPSMIIGCDAVVVGSGSGGGVVAGVLANAGYKVLVLEKGKYCARRNLSLLEGPAMQEMYLSGGLLASDDLGMVVLAGSTVGGGSTINWSASVKTPAHVIKEWCDEYELELFDSDLYREATNVVCEKMGVQSEIQEEGFNNEILRKGCEELGYDVENIPRNSPPDHYCGWCCFGCKDGRKLGVSETWLVDVMNSGHGAILPGCEAIQVLQAREKGKKKGIAVGVAFEFQQKGEKQIWIAEAKVIVIASGALCTPHLLKKSGLKNPNIGNNLHLHPVTMAWGHFPHYHYKKAYEGGIMTAMSKVVAGSEKSKYGALIQTPALHPGMFAGLMPWISGTDIKGRMCKFSKTAHIFALARDKGSGTVKSPNSISYKMEEEDEMNLKKGVEKVLRILAAAGAEEIGTHHCKGKTLKVKQASLDEFEKFVKDESSRALSDLSTPICSAHQMGSCRLGVDPRTSAVKPSGETWEVEGLFVADASVLPTALGVNPMVTVQAIAYCITQSVLDVLRRKKRE